MLPQLALMNEEVGNKKTSLTYFTKFTNLNSKDLDYWFAVRKEVNTKVILLQS